MSDILMIPQSAMDNRGDSQGPVMIVAGDIVTQVGLSDGPVVVRRVRFQGREYYAEYPRSQVGSAWAILSLMAEQEQTDGTDEG